MDWMEYQRMLAVEMEMQRLRDEGEAFRRPTLRERVSRLLRPRRRAHGQKGRDRRGAVVRVLLRRLSVPQETEERSARVQEGQPHRGGCEQGAPRVPAGDEMIKETLFIAEDAAEAMDKALRSRE